MIYTIKNSCLTVEINDLGGELFSIKSAGGTEYLWQGDAAYWSGRAYNLFPIVGRLTEGKYRYNGETYQMNLHGFVRKTVLNVREQSNDRIVFCLKANEATLKQYPFDFEFLLTYTLDGNTLTTFFEVINLNEEELPFAVGGHPGFNVPLTEGEKFEDYFLEFDAVSAAKAIVMSETCYTTEKLEDFPLEKGYILPLKHSLFDNDAIVLTDMSKGVTLKSKKGCKSIRIVYPDMKYLGIWHKPKSDAPYVCIEPWTSLPSYDNVVDDMETKRDMVRLKRGEKYGNAFNIIIK